MSNVDDFYNRINSIDMYYPPLSCHKIKILDCIPEDFSDKDIEIIEKMAERLRKILDEKERLC